MDKNKGGGGIRVYRETEGYTEKKKLKASLRGINLCPEKTPWKGGREVGKIGVGKRL